MASRYRYPLERRLLLEQVNAEVAETARWTGLERLDPDLLRALAKVPRHRFVAPELESSAYLNAPLPIGHGQTISQPFIVALMTELAGVRPGSRVLEIGTGSGYQAAILAEMGCEVYSIERVEALAAQAARHLERQGYRQVSLRVGDGYEGWPEHAPYEAIIVTAAIAEPPPALLAQLAPGGRLVVPLGEPQAGQSLTLITRLEAGEFDRQAFLPVTFVPFLRGAPLPIGTAE